MVKYGFLGICGLTVVCMTALIALGHDGAITDTLLGVGAAFSGANLWQLANNKEMP